MTAQLLQTLTATSNPLPITAGESFRLGKAYGAARALAIAELARRAHADNRCALVLTTNVADAEALANQVSFFLGTEGKIELFPDLEVLPYDAFSPHQDLVSKRLRILRDLPGDLPGDSSGKSPMTLIAAAPTLLPQLAPQTYLSQRGINIHTGQQLDRDAFQTRLDDSGYQRVTQVGLHGDYAVRGSLVDFFPTGHEAPIRVDFFDNQIESLREFDPDSQITTGKIESLDTLPAREIPIDAEAVKKFRQSYRQRFEGNPARSLIYREVTERRLPGGIENYLPLFFDTTATLWDYLPKDSLVICCDDLEGALESAWQQTLERHEQAGGDPERPALNPEELYRPATHHIETLNARPLIRLETVEIPTEQLGATATNLNTDTAPGMLINRREEEPSRALREFLTHRPKHLLFVSESPGRREMLIDILRQEQTTPKLVESWSDFIGTDASGTTHTAISVAPLDKGVWFKGADLAILTEQELFGEAPKRKRRRRRVKDPTALISDLTDLHVGAPVVHADHGVGRYVGLTNLAFDDTPTEFVTLEYAGADRLHVPVASLHLISRYTGASPEHAPLHRLGSDQWAKARRKAAEKIRDVAAELLDLYSKRAARVGFSYQLSPGDAEKFADGFPFVPTDDQAKAIAEVTQDLAAAKPDWWDDDEARAEANYLQTHVHLSA